MAVSNISGGRLLRVLAITVVWEIDPKCIICPGVESSRAASESKDMVECVRVGGADGWTV